MTSSKVFPRRAILGAGASKDVDSVRGLGLGIGREDVAERRELAAEIHVVRPRLQACAHHRRAPRALHRHHARAGGTQAGG